jgi:hypothetical protein
MEFLIPLAHRLFPQVTYKMKVSCRSEDCVPENRIANRKRVKRETHCRTLISIYLCLYNLLLELRRFFNSLILYTVGTTPWMGDKPIKNPLPTHRTTQT